MESTTTHRKSSIFLTFLAIKRQRSWLLTDKNECKYPSVDLWTQYANFISPLNRHWTIRAQKAIAAKHLCVIGIIQMNWGAAK